ncbi:SDR family oxidoreductase [Thioclava atlantica]|uniref:Short-chain dehydrogenase/reductase SDR n=1 Tax=Thioclava atlantica TaxID=1317124 RepID=A0A085TSF9_9RHOB|nr:SDR family oxidoreductase [Thioclava atlantica]KFE33656.1 short-chain dehydrogenase/reductase SDR [Thioclava atlantica]
MVKRTAIVTGAARGIGRAVTEMLLDKGWQVAALDLDIGPLDPREGLRAIRCDLAREDVIRAAVAEAGFDRVDLLVNNGGPADPHCGPLEELSLERWNDWVAPHLTGSFLMTRECLPGLRAARGAVVNIASTRALQSEPDTYAYAAAKGGVVALTHAMAVGLGPDVRVNAIAPGWINSAGAELSAADHAQHPAGRVGEPADIAEAVLYLAGAGFVTGQVLVVDGGMTRKMIYAD